MDYYNQSELYCLRLTSINSITRVRQLRIGLELDYNIARYERTKGAKYDFKYLIYDTGLNVDDIMKVINVDDKSGFLY
jgi:hypothetical protein